MSGWGGRGRGRGRGREFRLSLTRSLSELRCWLQWVYAHDTLLAASLSLWLNPLGSMPCVLSLSESRLLRCIASAALGVKAPQVSDSSAGGQTRGLKQETSQLRLWLARPCSMFLTSGFVSGHITHPTQAWRATPYMHVLLFVPFVPQGASVGLLAAQVV